MFQEFPFDNIADDLSLVLDESYSLAQQLQKPCSTCHILFAFFYSTESSLDIIT